MSSAVSFGTNTNAQRKRVYYTGTDTILEGYPLCYDSDTTTNVLGIDRADDSVSTTTTAGSKNEGKFLRVEQPATANFITLAGFVAPGGWTGKAGPRWLEVYIPNGAIIPVYTDVSVSYSDKMYLENAQYTVTTTASAGAYCGEAVDTIDRSSTAGLCQVKVIDPCNAQIYDSIETIASDNTVAIASVETIASDNTVAIASVETIASDNTVAIASVETIASDNTVAIASVETIASDNVVAIQTHISDAWAQFSNGVAAQTFNDSSISSVASDMNHRWSDMVAGISNFNVIMSNAGLW